MIELPTLELIALDAETEETCKKGQEQAAQQAAAKAAKEAADAAAKAAAEAAKIPEDAIKQLDDILDQFSEMVSGIKKPNTKLDPNAMINSIKSATDPVIDGIVKSITGIVGVLIPGLSQLSDAMGSIGSLASDLSGKSALSENKIDIDELVPDLPDIPEEVKVSLLNAKDSILSLMLNLTFLPIRLIFKILGLVMDMFNLVKRIVPLDPLDTATSYVTDLGTFLEKVPDLASNAASKIGNAMETTVRLKIREIQALKVPPAPDDLPVPEVCPTCPTHSSDTTTQPPSTNLEDEEEQDQSNNQ